MSANIDEGCRVAIRMTGRECCFHMTSPRAHRAGARQAEAMAGGSGAIDSPLIAIPPSVILSLIIAGFHGSLFFLLGATRGRHLVFYLGLAAIAGLTGQIIATVAALPAPVSVGDCNVTAVVAACWVAFALSRALRLEVSGRTRV